jgi:hypothetical protein
VPLIAAAAATMTVLAAALTWPPPRQRITARAWCVISPPDVRVVVKTAAATSCCPR